MAALAQVSLFMDLGRVLSHGLFDRTNRCQLLIVNLNQLLCLLQDIPGLGHYQTNSIAHAAGNVAFCNHYIPVLLEMAHLVVGHILGRKHGQHSRKGQRIPGVDIQHLCPRIHGPHG